MRKGGPNGLKPDPDAQMNGMNDHDVAMAVHGDQDVFGTPLKQIMRGFAPRLFRHQSPDRRNLLSPLVLVNLWIPLQQVTRPLTLMDRRTLDAPRQQLRYALPTDSFLERRQDMRFNDVWSFLHDEAHQWYYRADMGHEQAYVFDTLGEPHGSFMLPGEAVAEMYFKLLCEQLAQLAHELERAQGVAVRCIPCDLADTSQVEKLIVQLQDEDLGMIVSNAGYGVAKGEYLDADAAAMEAMYRANAIAPARLLRELLPAMVQRGRGGVIVTGSMEGDVAFPYSTAYAASKAFLHSLVLGLWHELRGSGVDVLLLAPGSTDTDAPVLQGISRDQLVGTMSPAAVAQQALGQLGRRPHFITGIHNRLFIGLLRLLPRGLATRMAGYGMKQAIDGSSLTD